ncbi:isochorismatase family protein, partial [Burkholderia pseudomallei]
MARAAVLVVDMQRGLLPRAKPAHRLDEVVEGINRLTAAARAAGAPVC